MEQQQEAKAFSARTVETIKAPGYHRDGDTVGLYLQVTATGAKSWLYRFKLDGKKREMGLGEFPLFSLDEARNQAKAQRQLLSKGIDPIEERRKIALAAAATQSKRKLWTDCAKECIGELKAGWKNRGGKKRKLGDAKAAVEAAKSEQIWTNSLATYADPVVGELYVDEIKNEHLIKVLKPIWATMNPTAQRIRERMETIIGWATYHGHRDKGVNPASWKDNLEYAFPVNIANVKKKKNRPSLPRAKVYEFIQMLRRRPGDDARLMEFTILTAARSLESREARDTEIDLDDALWTCPEDRMKEGEAHTVPLSERALEIVRSQPKGFLFASNQRKRKLPLGNMALKSLIKRMRADGTIPAEWPHFVPHGFRTTFKTWSFEVAGYDDLMSEFALAHKIPDEVKATYLRGTAVEKRREMMQAWQDFCETPYAKAKVVPIRKAA